MRFVPVRTLRGRLLLLALLVEAVMLTFLIANSLRLVRDNMGEQAKAHAEQIAPILKAALVAPMAQFDYATVQAVLDESQAIRGIDYLAVTDRQGQVVAQSGWPVGKALPEADRFFSIDTQEQPPRYNVFEPITLAGQPLGTLRFGVDLSRIVAARQALLSQGVSIALAELLLSAGLLTLLGLLVTRQLSVLTRASEQVASGGVPAVVPEGDDDIGHLGAAFNAMSRAIGERVGQLTKARDETAQLAAAMEQEHARLAALLSAMDFGVLFSGKSNEVVYSNAAFRMIWGIEPESCVPGCSLSGLFRQLAVPVQLPLTGDVCGMEAAPDLEIVLDDGRVLNLHRRQVTEASGAALGYLWLFVDVTQERHFGQQLLEAKDKAEAANQAKSQFLAMMSHEIRTPMNGILGMAQLLQEPDLHQAEVMDYAGTILKSGQTLLTLLNDILDLSKVEAGKIVLESAEFDIQRLLSDTTLLFTEAAHAKGLLISAVWHGSNCSFTGDSTRLRQMLNNLVSNAIKFTEKGSVSIEGRSIERGADKSVLEFSVSDTGIGIPPEKHTLLFKPFSQTDSSTTRKFGGTGLGLSIVRSLARLMGGDVWIESEAGQGARFIFRVTLGNGRDLPANPDGVPAAVVPAMLGQPAFRAGGSVLLVDDNSVNRKVVGAMLAKQGFSVESAENGQEAVDRLKVRQDFQLVFMDCQMPVLDGFAATQAIRAWEAAQGLPRIPVIALTAGAFAEDRERCFAAGMDDFLAKPVNLANLVGMLQKWASDESRNGLPDA